MKNSYELKRANIGWCKKEGDKKGMDGMHVAMEMTFDPGNLHKPHCFINLLQQYVGLVEVPGVKGHLHGNMHPFLVSLLFTPSLYSPFIYLPTSSFDDKVT